MNTARYRLTNLLKAHPGLFFALLFALTSSPAHGQDITQASDSLLPSHVAPTKDISNELASLGNKPRQSGMRDLALNIWDMMVSDGKIFIGMGNTTTNAGPIPIWTYDLNNQSWDIAPELLLPTEAIERFRLIDGDLYVPAADPTGRATDKSKFFRRQPGGTWTHYSSLQSLTAHIRDLAFIDGWLVGVGNSRNPHELVAGQTGTVKVPLSHVQKFSGGQWPLAQFESAITTQPAVGEGAQANASRPDTDALPPIDIATTQRNRVANWFFSVFELHNGLYASTRWMGYAPTTPTGEIMMTYHQLPPSVPPFPHQVKWDRERAQWMAPPPESLDRLIPICENCDQSLVLYPHKPVLFGELWWAPIKSYGFGPQSYRGAYNQSIGLIVKPADGPGRWVKWPQAKTIGEAVQIIDEQLYVLTNTPIDPPKPSHAKDSDMAESSINIQRAEDSQPKLPPEAYQVEVYRLTQDLSRARYLSDETGFDVTQWEALFTFQSPNPVRSFLKAGSEWYFGLGLNQGEPQRQAGALWVWRDQSAHQTQQPTTP